DLDRDTTDPLRVTQLALYDSPLDPASVGAALAGQYGSLTLNQDGSYSYQVDRNNPAVQNLPPGQQLIERFEYEMSDGTSVSRATLTITIGENDAPVSQDQTVTTPEDQTYVFLTSNFAFSDQDQGDQISLVRIDSLPAQGQLFLDGAAVTPGAEIPIAAIADGRLTFVPVENASGDSYAQLQFSVKDSSGTENAFSADSQTLTINVTPVNDPPQLDLDGNDSSAPGQDYRTRFVPGQPVAVADLDTQISDLDNSQIQSALITLTNRPNGSSEFLALSGNLPGGITASAYDPTTGELRLTGSAPLADYQTAIASLVYGNQAAVRNTSDRLVTVVVNDGEADSNLAQTVIAYDTDGDGVIDQLDLDMDNDGIPNAVEMGDNPNRDTDGDGILDLLDLDSDNDGLTDLRETGLSDQVWQTLDRNGDGVIDASNAFGRNGLADAVETSSDSGNLQQPPVDTDQDGAADFQDRDSDNDGFSDLLESGLGFSDADGDGQVDGPDQDGDGIRDGADRRPGFGGGSNQIWADRNSSGIPDHREISRRRSGSTSSDTITGTDGDDILSGFSDLDVIFGRGGNDTIVGGSDKDRLFGDQGNDTVSGGSNDDWIEGGTENDILNGGTGNDRIFGGDGDDIINAGQGNDWASGDAGNDRITGNEGNDKLLGGAGNDILLGDRGNDLLQGGLGKDRLTGGQGRDRFIYSSVQEFGDVIVDFDIVKDQFDLSALFPGKAGSMQNVRVKQQGEDALVQVNAGRGFRNLATLEDVQADTLDQRHFKF
ncbi:MAG: VCBS domain-containing protein, partial [Elainella sp.]